MVELLRGCSIICATYICATYDGSPVDKNSVRKLEEIYPSFHHLNFVGNKQKFQQNKFSTSGRRDRIVPTCFYKSSVAYKQEVSRSTWDQEVRFDTNGYLQKKLPLVRTVTEQELQDFGVEVGHSLSCQRPVVQQELDVEIENHPSCPKLERQFGLSKTKLHFLEERDEELLSNRILILGRSNKVKSALELFASMEACGLQPNAHACNSLLSSLARNGSLNDALKVFEIMKKKGMTTSHTFSLILKAVASAQDCNSALTMFNALEAEGMSKTFDVIVYNTMISICGKARNWVETENMWRKLRQNAHKSTKMTYKLLVTIFVQCGQAELAVDAYYEMVQSGLEPSEDVLKAILSSCTKEGNWELGLKIFQKMLDNGVNPNIIAFNSMINCLGKAGKDDLAFEVYDILKSVGHRPDEYTWSALLCALYRSKRYADAILFFEGIKTEIDLDLNAHLYNIVLMSCRRLGLWECSVQLLWQMEKSEIQVSAVSYNHAISACEVARKPEVALQVYRHMIQQKCAPDTFTYLSLIRSCIWGSLWTGIEDIMESAVPNSSLYNALIHGLCSRGKIILAKKLYKKMQSNGLKPDGKTRALMKHLRR